MGKPDFAVHRGGALTGYADELKPPGAGAVMRFSGAIIADGARTAESAPAERPRVGAAWKPERL